MPFCKFNPKMCIKTVRIEVLLELIRHNDSETMKPVYTLFDLS